MTANQPSSTSLNYFTNFHTELSPSHIQSLLDYASKPPDTKNYEVKQLLASLVDNIKSINLTFRDAPFYQERLSECSSIISPHKYSRGDPISLNGEKCNEVVIILSGAVNVYDMKHIKDTRQEKANHDQMIKDIQDTRAQAATEAANQAPPELPTPMPAKKSRQILRQSFVNGFMAARISKKFSTKPSIGKSRTFNGFSLTHKLKIKSLVAFLRIKGKNVAKQMEEDIQRIIETLPEHEQLLQVDETCRKKYYRGTVCVLNLKEIIRVGQIINEECLLKEYRSPLALIASEDVKCLKINRELFRDIFAQEIVEADNKRRFFLNFFSTVNQISLINSLPYISTKNYKVHEKVYTQGEKSKGFYFVRGGGEVRLYMEIQHKLIKGDEEPADKSQTEFNDLFLPGQKRTVQKRSVVVGIVSQGDFLGDEDMFLGKAMRKYTAVSSSNELQLYYISPDYYSTLSFVCPEMFQILKGRAEQRNDWMEDKIKNYEYINDKAMQPTSSTSQASANMPKNFQDYWSTQLFSSKEPVKAEKKNTSSSNRMVLIKDQDSGSLSQENSVGHFLVLNKKPADTKSIEATSSMKTTETKTPEDEDTNAKSPEEHGSRLFEYQRSQQKDYRHRRAMKNETPLPHSKTPSSTSKPERDFSENFQKSVVKQIIASRNLSRAGDPDSASPISPFKHPQYSIKSYRSTKMSALQSPTLKTEHQFLFETELTPRETPAKILKAGQFSPELRLTKSTLQHGLSLNLQNIMEVSKFDTTPSYRSSQVPVSAKRIIEKEQNELHLPKGYTTQRASGGSSFRLRRIQTDTNHRSATNSDMASGVKEDYKVNTQRSESREKGIELSSAGKPKLKIKIKTLRKVGKAQLVPKCVDYGF